MEELFAKRLTELIKNSNYILADMEESVGKKAATISRYASGEIKGVKRDTIVKIANFFNVSPAWLAGLSDEKYQNTKIDKLGNLVVSIPLLGTVKAGYNYLAQENWIGTVDVDKKLADGNELFALKVKGDSMFPVLVEDDIVIIKKQDDFETGDIVVALINGDEATIKKGKKTNNGILLQPFNTNYEPLLFTYDEIESIPVTIIGIVKQLKREF